MTRTEELLFCRWKVCTSGYKIVWTDQKGFILAVKGILGETYSHIYDPLATADLFRDFAEVLLKHKSILEFANQHGMLTEGETFYLPNSPPFHGEPVQVWEREISSMKAWINNWLRIRSRDIKSLRKQITISRARTDGEFLSTLERRLQKTINEHMKGNVSPSIYKVGERLNLFFSPNNLLGALWFQFARALTGNYQFKKCRNWGCNNTIFTSSEEGKTISDPRRDWSVSRSNKDTCSARCRKAISRKREQALRLIASGMSNRKAAKTLNIKLMDLKWLFESSRRKS